MADRRNSQNAKRRAPFELVGLGQPRADPSKRSVRQSSDIDLDIDLQFEAEERKAVLLLIGLAGRGTGRGARAWREGLYVDVSARSIEVSSRSDGGACDSLDVKK